MATVTNAEVEAAAKAAYGRSFAQIDPVMLPPGWRERFEGDIFGHDALEAAWNEIADAPTRHHFKDLVGPVLDAAAAVRD